MKKNTIAKIAGLLSLTFLLASCGGDGGAPTADSGTDNNTETQISSSEEREEVLEESKTYKNEINIAMTAQPPTLDAGLTASNASNGVAGHIFEQLYTMNENYEPTPELAESYEVNEDGTVYTFTLRQGVLFHNGEEMTADDVVASMNRWLSISSRAKTLLADAYFEKIDDYTVTLTVQQATSDVMIILSSRILFPAIMPADIADNAPAEGVSEYIGTGPYKLEEWKADQYIHLSRYEDYQPVEAPSSAYAGYKEAATENLYYFFVTDHATRIAGLKTGEYDVAESIPLENYDELVDYDGVNLYAKPSGSLNLFFNTTEGVLADIDMRHAILAAINCDEVMLASYANKDHYTLDPGYMNIDQPQWAVKNGSEYYNQADAEKAKELLAETGYNGETIRILTTPDYQEMYSASIVIQEQLRQIGVNAEILSFDFPTFYELRGDVSQWDIFITSNSYNLIPPQILAVDPDWAGFDHPQVAESLTAIRSAASEAEAREEWAALQQFMYEYASSTILGHYNSSMATSDKVEDMVYFDHTIYWNAKVEK